jgi:hypothetical protein
MNDPLCARHCSEHFVYYFMTAHDSLIALCYCDSHLTDEETETWSNWPKVTQL